MHISGHSSSALSAGKSQHKGSQVLSLQHKWLHQHLFEAGATKCSQPCYAESDTVIERAILDACSHGDNHISQET